MCLCVCMGCSEGLVCYFSSNLNRKEKGKKKNRCATGPGVRTYVRLSFFGRNTYPRT